LRNFIEGAGVFLITQTVVDNFGTICFWFGRVYVAMVIIAGAI